MSPLFLLDKNRNILLIVFFVSLFFFSFSFFLEAAERVIKLKDGTQLKGEVLSLKDGQYRIRTKVLGVVVVDQEDITAISSGSAIPSTESAGEGMASFQKEMEESYKKRITSDPNIMNSLEDLAGNKEIMEILMDKDLLSAIRRQDMEYLKKDPKFLKFMNHPAIQGIMKKVGSSEE